MLLELLGQLNESAKRPTYYAVMLPEWLDQGVNQKNVMLPDLLDHNELLVLNLSLPIVSNYQLTNLSSFLQTLLNLETHADRKLNFLHKTNTDLDKRLKLNPSGF
jgi:hypothetical protein